MGAAKYTEGRGFSAQELWNWTWRLRKLGKLPDPVKQTKAVAPRVRLAKVVAARDPRPGEQVGRALLVEVAGVRIAVPVGFDRGTFSAVLDVVETRRAWGAHS